MEVRVIFQGNKRFKAQRGEVFLIVDQPKEKGGDDQGLTPSETLLSSLGSCVGLYAKRYLQTQGFRADNLEVKVSADLIKENSYRLANIKVSIIPGVDLGEKKRALLIFVEKCPIHTALTVPTDVAFEIV